MLSKLHIISSPFPGRLLIISIPATADSSSSEEEVEDEDAEKKPKSKTVKETTYEWELLNDVKAIWLRNPKEVTEEEYTKFYQSLAKANSNSLGFITFQNTLIVFFGFPSITLSISWITYFILFNRILVKRSLYHGVTSPLKVMWSSRLFCLCLLRLLRIYMRVTITPRNPTWSCMLDVYSFLKNLMSFCPSIWTFWR